MGENVLVPSLKNLKIKFSAQSDFDKNCSVINDQFSL